MGVKKTGRQIEQSFIRMSRTGKLFVGGSTFVESAFYIFNIDPSRDVDIAQRVTVRRVKFFSQNYASQTRVLFCSFCVTLLPGLAEGLSVIICKINVEVANLAKSYSAHTSCCFFCY